MQAREAFSILLVDDDSTVVRVMSRILSDFEPLRFATSGHVALKLARESVPDLVLLDLQMPVMGGLDVVRNLKQGEHMPVIVIVTAYDKYASPATKVRSWKPWDCSSAQQTSSASHPMRL